MPAFVGGGIGNPPETHIAAHLAKRFPLVLAHPRLEIRRARCAGGRRRAAAAPKPIWVTEAPAIVLFTTSTAVCTPPAIARDPRMRPARAAVASQAEREIAGIRERQRADDLELFDVDVGVVEPLEKNETVSTRPVELAGEIGERRLHRRELDRDGNAAALLDARARSRRPAVRRRLRLSPCRWPREKSAIRWRPRRPARADSRTTIHPLWVTAVQRGDHGNAHRLFHPLKMLEVFVGPSARSGSGV